MVSRLSLPLAVVFALFGCALLPRCLGECQQSGESPVLDDKVAESDVVIQGEVRRQIRMQPGDSSYTAEVNVQCVFKGGPLPATINVTEAGTKEDSCVQAQLQEGSVSLIYLKRVGEDLTPTFSPDPAERKYLEELKYVCGLNVQLPSGSGMVSSGDCQPENFATDYDMDCNTHTSQAPSPALSAADRLQIHWGMVIATSLLMSAFLLSVS